VKKRLGADPTYKSPPSLTTVFEERKVSVMGMFSVGKVEKIEKLHKNNDAQKKEEVKIPLPPIEAGIAWANEALAEMGDWRVGPLKRPPVVELECKGTCAYCGGRLMGGIAVGWGECELCGAI
jgi:hypothetical protein